MEMDSAHQDHDDKCIEETTSDQLLHPDSPDINDIFGEPLVHPRVGYEYQVEIPLMITESERDKLLVNPADAEVIVDVSHSFLMGLPIPIVQVLDEVTNIKDGGIGFNNSDDSVNKNGPLESKNRKRSQINSNKKGSKLKVESLDVMLNPGKESTATSPDSKVMGSTDLDQMHGSKSYLTVPGSLGDSWSDIEVDSFILGLYIFGKNLIQVKRFIESKGMGDILSFYYGKFYRSDGYRRWSDCRKMRRRKCIHGQKIFTGWRQQELLSRLLPQVSQECQNTLLEVSKSFAEGRTSLAEYVSSLKITVGICNLIEAVGVGKGKDGLTGIVMEPIKIHQFFSVRPEIPIGKACSSLTSSDIIKFLTGDFRLSKARSNDLFWEAVWPRLLARGWHSEQPKNEGCASSKHSLVFLVPGVKKFSRRKLVKGDHYFDSISDVLSKVASEPKILELEDEETGVSSCKEGNGWVPEAKLDNDDPSDHQRHCYLKPRVSTCNLNLMKFTVVDTSLACGEKSSKVRELKSLPVESLETINNSNLTSSRVTGGDSSEDSQDESDSADMSLNGQKNTTNSNHAKAISHSSSLTQRVSTNSPDAAKKLVENNQDQNTNTSDDKHLRRNIKHQFSRRTKSGHSNYLAPLIKRRRLTACAKAETSRAESLSVGPLSKQEKSHCMLGSSEASKNDVSQEGPSPREKASSISSSDGGSPEDETVILGGTSVGMDLSHEKNDKPQTRPLIDLNLPQVQSDSENGERLATNVENSQVASTANGSCCSSDRNILMEDSKALRTSVNAGSAEEQPIMKPQRQSTRNRPLTTKALEALASGFLNTRRKRKGTEVQAEENPILRPSRRARSRVTGTPNCANPGTGMMDSKEANGADGVCNDNTYAWKFSCPN